ncbi:MAG TPA: RNA polymerase sigma factor [Cyclobacteriaceae bacterium]|nr:RNA polymerase sigma factor [Cyclobacteriaceae bacterium]
MTEPEQQSILETWLTQYKGLVFKIVRSYAFTAMDREDLFQEITVQIWRSIPTFRAECAVTTWIYRISLNTAIRFSQKERKRSGNQTDIEGVRHTLHENNISQDERLSWLYAQIAKLDEIDRSITLLMLDGFSYKEMAAIVGITESNIGVKINRIKKHLMIQSKTYDNYGI